MPPRPAISDCTLRDARHAPGVFLEPRDCVEIARLLAALHIDEIEIGLADSDPDEMAILEAIHRADLGVPTSVVHFVTGTAGLEDAAARAADVGCRRILMSIPSSAGLRERKLRRSFRAVCHLLEKAVEAGRRHGLEVIFSGEDAARADIGELAEYVAVGADAGAVRFRFAETVSCLDPREVARRIARLVEATDLPVEIHCHSAFGLGVANSVAALDAGAAAVSCTVEGIGERGGNTSLGAMLLFLHHFRGRDDLVPEGLGELSSRVAEATGLFPHRFGSIVGESAFEYELGAQFIAAEYYEAYPPESVGNRRRLTLGRKADPAGLAMLLAELGIEIGDAERLALATRLRRYVRRTRRTLTAADLAAFLEGGFDDESIDLPLALSRV